MTTFEKMSLAFLGYLGYKEFFVPGKVVENRCLANSYYLPYISPLTKIIYSNQTLRPEPKKIFDGVGLMEVSALITPYYKDKIFVAPSSSTLKIKDLGYVEIDPGMFNIYQSPYPYWKTKEELNNPFYDLAFDMAKIIGNKSVA